MGMVEAGEPVDTEPDVKDGGDLVELPPGAVLFPETAGPFTHRSEKSTAAKGNPAAEGTSYLVDHPMSTLRPEAEAGAAEARLRSHSRTPPEAPLARCLRGGGGGIGCRREVRLRRGPK